MAGFPTFWRNAAHGGRFCDHAHAHSTLAAPPVFLDSTQDMVTASSVKRTPGQARAIWPWRLRRVERTVSHVPQALRALVRADEVWLAILAALLGVAAGLLVVAMNHVSQFAHEMLFGINPGEHLSAQAIIAPLRAFVPSLGGLLMGGIGIALARWHPRRAVDPIEANALYGGKMSLKDSLILVVQTLISNGFGASVGLEAGFSQIGAAVASRVGRAFRVRRADLRVLVGAGAGAAIAAAFNAPLTGAFYAYELVIGTYTLGTLAPVIGAAITAVSVQRMLIGDQPGFDMPPMGDLDTAAFLPLIILGVVAALAGIVIMRGVTVTEELFRRSLVPPWLRPVIGGLAVGGLALLSPTVLSSGHGALRAGLQADIPLGRLALLLGLKAAASAISIGSGFRGGLFFASLLMGALLGKLFAGIMLLISPMPMFPDVIYALVGMSAFAVAVVGGPLTMAFLALEGTGSLPLTVAVLAAAVVSSITVRRTFGYSFATWRFHLRGESIRSAVDIGWIRTLTVGRLMRRDLRTVRADTPLAAFRRDYPLGSTNRVVAVDEADRYAGIVWLSDAHAADEAASRVAEMLHNCTTVLLPDMNIKQAIELFEQAEADALAVVDSPDSMHVIGFLTEHYALRRYAEELDRRQRDLSGS
jgi:CIC family chloride channel protein